MSNQPIPLPTFRFGETEIEDAKLPPDAERFLDTDGAGGLWFRIDAWRYEIDRYLTWPPHVFEGFARIMRDLWGDAERNKISRQFETWTRIIQAAVAARGKGEE